MSELHGDGLSLKARIADGDRLLGVLLRMPAEELVEMVAIVGFDFVLVDCEHGPADLVALRGHIAVAAMHALPVLVRTGADEPGLVLRALDAGAEGIVAPHIDTAGQARSLVDAVHYPPLGHRGFATYSRAGSYGRAAAADHQRRMSARTLVIGMIESPIGVANAADVLSTPGLDGTMIGTADLQASSTEDDQNPASMIARVHELARDLGAVRMDIVNGQEQAEQSFAAGADMVVYNLTHTLMVHLAALRSVRSDLS